MTSILFVDDEIPILEGLKNAFRKKRSHWNMEFCDNGAEAIRRLEQETYTILVTDMRMPGVDGVAVLNAALHAQPEMFRIVLSGQADRESILKILPFSHHFLSKPCSVEKLEGLLERAIVLQEKIGSESVLRIAGSVVKLEPVSRVFAKLGNLLADPNSTLEAIAGSVREDPAISARILQLANSAYFGFSRQIVSISEAVSLLGFDIVRAVTLSSALFGISADPGGANSYAWVAERSQRAAALAASFLANRKTSTEAFSAALLMDIGIPILARADPPLFRRTVETSLRTKSPLYRVEKDVYGATHAEVGAHLLGLWGLPLIIVEAVASHHCPCAISDESKEVTVATHVAAALVEGRENGIDGVRRLLDVQFLAETQMTEQSDRWVTDAMKR